MSVIYSGVQILRFHSVLKRNGVTMEPILVYGFPLGSSMGVIAALEWLGKPYRLSRVDMLGEMREAPFLRLNPRVETPALVTDDGRVLTETMAIANWLAVRDTSRMISFDAISPEADRMMQLMAFINTGFTGAFSPLWTAMELPEPDPAYEDSLRRYGVEQALNRHDRLEELIGDTPFLVGDRPTLADGVLIGVARWLDVHAVAPRDRWPKLDALRERLERLPEVQYALAIERGETPAGSGAMIGELPIAEVIEGFGRKA
jgi:glutathione S-transferase